MFISGFFWTLGRLTATLVFDLITFFSSHLLLGAGLLVAVGVHKIIKKVKK